MVNETYEWTIDKMGGGFVEGSTPPVKSSKNGLNCKWSVYKLWPLAARDLTCFLWKFKWDELKEQGVEGFNGIIRVSFTKHGDSPAALPKCEDFPKTIDVNMTKSPRYIRAYFEKSASNLFSRNDICFSTHFVLTPIMKTDDSQLLEDNFKSTNKTDAILVVDGKKLHVNKMFLSIHSEFFDTLFNSDFKEKSMEEIPIGDVEYKDFARLLSVVYPNPILPSVENAATLLKLADRFIMPLVIRLVEQFLICNSCVYLIEKIVLADKYSICELMNSCLLKLKSAAEVNNITRASDYEELSDATKAKLLHRMEIFL